MTKVKVPNSIRKVAESIKSYVGTREDIWGLDMINSLTVNEWYHKCGKHEMFHQDADRYISDLVTHNRFGRGV